MGLGKGAGMEVGEGGEELDYEAVVKWKRGRKPLSKFVKSHWELKCKQDIIANG